MTIRAALASFGVLVAWPLAFGAACARGHEVPRASGASEEPAMNLYAMTVNTLEGKATSLAEYAGKVTLVVNVASYCGNTPQYAGLERLQQKYGARGFSVLAFPSNDFGKQEPGTAGEIREFCSKNYSVTFPLFEKVETKKGPGQSPVYAALERATGKLPSWNFGKFLVGRDGRVLEYIEPNTEPEDESVVRAVEKALALPVPG